LRQMLALALFAALAACSPQPQAAKQEEAPTAARAPDVSGMPAGEYKMDPSHSTLLFRLSHLGFSNYTASFTKFDATLQIDPANPSAGSLVAKIDPRSLTLPAPPEGFTQTLLGPQWLDAGQFKEITFTSTAIESTGANTARITGNLTLHGVTKPITLDATYNGGIAGFPQEPQPRAHAGFSAHGTFKRSDFGMGYGVPAPGTTMGVGDDVEVIIEAEFLGPPQTPAAPPAAKQN
jgi:polyisoprenoid-binding protein YceI